MNLRNGSLSTFSAVAVVLGLAACGGGSRQSQASAPPQPQTMPPTNEYGAAMGQPYGAAPGQSEMPATPGSTSPSNPPSGAAQGAYGPGATQAPGAPPMGATEPSPAPQGAMNQPGMGGPGAMGGPTQGAPSTMGGMQQGSTSGMPGGPGMTSGATGGTMDVSGLDDAQLAAVIQALHMGEILEAQMAEKKATAAEVKRFARDLSTQHRDMENRVNAVFTRIQITPSDNAVSNQMKNDTQNDMATLQAMKGKDFDREYIDAEIRDHNRALELLDRAIPNAKSAELKTELQNARTKVEAHLRMAEKIQQMLQKGATNKQRTGTEPNSPY
jgi:putative membrane protein